MRRFPIWGALCSLAVVLAVSLPAPAANALPAHRAAILSGACSGVLLKADFVAGQYCKSGQQYASLLAVPGASFARASTKTCATAAGVVVLAASGAPCITDLGLLIEESRTNLVLRSQELDNALWDHANVAVTADQIVAPDGTLTGELLTSSGGAARLHNHTIFTIANATQYTASAYFKAGSADAFLAFDDGGGTVWAYAKATLSGAGSVTLGGSGTRSGTISCWMIGWCRVTLTWTSTVTSAYVSLGPWDGSADSSNYPGTGGGKTSYAWGVELEQAAFATSYIPTTSAAATRATDLAFISVPIATPFSAIAWGSIPNLDGVRVDIVSVSDVTVNNRLELQRDADNRMYAALTTAGVYQAAPASISAKTGARVLKFGARIGPDEGQAFDGALTADTAVSLPTGLSRVYLGTNGTGTASYLNGYLQRAAVHQTGLPNGQLQAQIQ